MIELVIPSQRRDLGGFEVGRVLPWSKRRMVGPFIFFDHIGPADFPPDIPRSSDVRPHPHIGLSTITYLFRGEIVHRDSVGCHQVIRPGEVNWMTAGRGITHSERFDTLRGRGGSVEGIQAWIALPEGDEEIAPSFVHFDSHELPQQADTGTTVRLIAGAAFGMESPVGTHSPLFYAHAELDSGAEMQLDADYSERAVFVADGKIRIQDEIFAAGQMVVLSSRTQARIAATEAARVMFLGGEPVGPRHIWWNFVSSSKERIEQAKNDWRAGRFPAPVDDDKEFIPLPEEPAPPAEPMS